MSDEPVVGVIMGSESDWTTMRRASEVLTEFSVAHENRVVSAHRTPAQTAEFIRKSEEDGVQVFIAAAGMAAHLAGAVAANTTLPVIGVPMKGGALDGLDALLSTVQMPRGVPVGTLAIGKAGAVNAALLAGQILGLKYPEIGDAVKADRAERREQVLADSDPRG